MKHKFLSMAFGVIVAVTATGFAAASAPAEKIVCTDAPKSSWLPEARIREIFGANNFALAKLKISRGNCYEFYAVDKSGNVVEAYYHPISGDVVRYNRVVSGKATSEYESSTTPASAVR
jgi:hypothetical protein